MMVYITVTNEAGDVLERGTIEYTEEIEEFGLGLGDHRFKDPQTLAGAIMEVIGWEFDLKLSEKKVKE